MFKLAILAAACFTMAIESQAPALEKKGPDQTTVQGTIQFAMGYIETEKYEDLLKTIVEPEELKKMLKNQTIQELAKGFKGGNAEELLKVLKHIQDKKPVYSDEGKMATYTFPKEINRRGKILFINVDGKWYIRN